MEAKQSVKNPNIIKEILHDKSTTVAQKVWLISDIEVVDLCRSCFPGRAVTKDVSHENDVKNQQTKLVTTEKVTDPNNIFEPIVSNKGYILPINRQSVNANDIPFWKCLKSSFSWAYNADKLGFGMIAGTSVLSSTLPYFAAYTTAMTINVLTMASKGSGDMAAAYENFGISAAISLGMTLTYSIGNYFRERHRVKNEQAVLSDLRRSLSSFSHTEQIKPENSQMFLRAQSAQYILQGFGDSLIQGIVPAISAIGAVAIIAPYSPLGAAAVLVFSVPYLYNSIKNGKESSDIREIYGDSYNRLNNVKWSYLTGKGQLEMQLSGKKEQLLTHLDIEQKKIDEIWIRPAVSQQKKDFWLQPLNTLAIGTVGFVILNDVVFNILSPNAAGMTIGGFGMLTGALYSLNSSINAITNSVGTLLRNLPEVKLAHAVIEKGRKNIEESKNSINLELESSPEINISSLGFRYPQTGEKENQDVISDISFNIKAGELLGIVGPSGAGKTTLINLLNGIYEPTRGKIEFNNLDISNYSKESLWQASAYLLQQSGNFYAMSIRENIAMSAKKPLSDGDIMEMAAKAGFDEAIKKKEFGLDSVLGEWFQRGTSFSGGEYSRLALTRLLAAEGKFIILDEPTAGLDQHKADKVLNLIGELDATRIIISHDYGITSKADRILVIGYEGLNGGESEEQLNELKEAGRLGVAKILGLGTHAELLESCPYYRKCCEIQENRSKLIETKVEG
jgi:ABC-type multidrug transport system fused ATPase/permease subunit